MLAALQHKKWLPLYAGAITVLASLLASPATQAQTVNWSIGVSSGGPFYAPYPHASVNIHGGPGLPYGVIPGVVHVAPPPVVYYAPPPVVVLPAPVYVHRPPRHHYRYGNHHRPYRQPDRKYYR